MSTFDKLSEWESPQTKALREELESIPQCARDEKTGRPMSERLTEDPETVKREERIKPGAVRELQQRGQEMAAETPTMRERLARLHAGRFYDSDLQMNNGPEHRQEYVDFRWPVFVEGVEEDLREMLEPSEGMLVAASIHSVTQTKWQAMIQHILNEPKD